MKALLVCDNGHLEEVASIARKYNVGIEFGGFHKPELLENPRLAILEHHSCKDLVPRALHGAFGDLCPGSFDPLVRKVAERRVLQSLEVAGKLGIHDVIFHNGYVPRTSSIEGWVTRSAEFWRGTLRQTSEFFNLHLENMLEAAPTVIMRLVDEVSNPRLGVCFDIGHAHALSETPALEWVEVLGSRISYVHIHDNHGKKDEHLPLEEGNVPIKQVLDLIEIQSNEAFWAIETPPDGLVQSLEWIKKTYVVTSTR